MSKIFYLLKIFLDWIILSFSISIAYYFLPFIYIIGDSVWDRLKVAFLAGILLGLTNFLIKPIIKVISLPINILTMGLFNIIINAGMLWIVDYFINELKVSGFWGYILVSLVISMTSIVLSKIIFYEKKKK
jgi:putative membrane protein